MSFDLAVVLMTFPDRDCAHRIANLLLDKELVACINLLPGCESLFRWEGKVQTENEVLGLGKTTMASAQEIEAVLSDCHPYELPELIFLPIGGGGEKFLQWVAGETNF